MSRFLFPLLRKLFPQSPDHTSTPPPLPPRRKRLLPFLSLVLAGIVLGTTLALWLWSMLTGSLPPVAGIRHVHGLNAPVQIERDGQGIPTLRGENRVDVAFALGFVHGQDRFFQMDLLRRHSSGELAALFGGNPGIINEDRQMRVHRFRRRAKQRVARATPQEKEMLEAYSTGVMAGLGSLHKPPLEYLLLQTTPQPWKPEDTLLVVFQMYLNLQQTGFLQENAQGILVDLLPAELARFLTPAGSPWNAPMLGPDFPTPDIPQATAVDLRKEPTKWQPIPKDPGPGRKSTGSNNWAVAGFRSDHGGAILANDMHLGLFVPDIWYRARLIWKTGETTHQVTGATLPGTPAVVVGSTGRLAWGFTNVEGDYADLIVLEFDPNNPDRYRTPDGFRSLEKSEEIIEIMGQPSESITVKETIWGPVFDQDHRGRSRALCWVAHHPDAVNFELMSLETAESLEEALTIVPRAGTPGQNFTVADSRGNIAWTLLGRIPERVGFTGEVPTSWADGSRFWKGLLPSTLYPRILNPSEGIIWTANNRVVGEPYLSRIGARHFDNGARARQIRDGLRERKRLTESDMLAIQLDNRALFLVRWQKLLLEILSPVAIRDNPHRENVRREVVAWKERASVDSVGFRLVRTFRRFVFDTITQALTAPCLKADGRFQPYWLDANIEESVWQLITKQPAHLLPPGYDSWNALLLNCCDNMIRRIPDQDLTFSQALQRYTWGKINTARLRHPLSGGLGPVAQWLKMDMPADPLPGAPNAMPRIQTPSDGASQRMAVSPGKEELGYFHMPTGQSGHPLSPHYRDGHAAWVQGKATPFLPGETRNVLILRPK